jgi:hypothetical protein
MHAVIDGAAFQLDVEGSASNAIFILDGVKFNPIAETSVKTLAGSGYLAGFYADCDQGISLAGIDRIGSQ